MKNSYLVVLISGCLNTGLRKPIRKVPENNGVKWLLLSKLKKRLNKADRTIFNSDQPSLNTGSVLEGIKNFRV
jgi:hypothetical protein